MSGMVQNAFTYTDFPTLRGENGKQTVDLRWVILILELNPLFRKMTHPMSTKCLWLVYQQFKWHMIVFTTFLVFMTMK